MNGEKAKPQDRDTSRGTVQAQRLQRLSLRERLLQEALLSEGEDRESRSSAGFDSNRKWRFSTQVMAGILSGWIPG